MAGKFVLTDQDVEEAQAAILRQPAMPATTRSWMLFGWTLFFSLLAALLLILPPLPQNWREGLMGRESARVHLVVGLALLSAGWVLLILAWWILRSIVRK